MKIISIVGARPQFIKLAPLSHKLREQFDEKIVHTGQHFDQEMSSLFFKELEIPEPDYNLGISGGNHGEQTGKMLIGLEEILVNEKPDIVIVFGDTNSTLAGSLASAKLGIKTVHVEAGLRSFNPSMPEEINRIVADHTSGYLFAPTQISMKNLEDENLILKSYLTGDIMVDSLKSAIEKLEKEKRQNIYQKKFEKYFLLTLHRPYNVDNSSNLSGIFNELSKLSQQVIFPVHPRTHKIIVSNYLKIPDNFTIINPVGYLDFVMLEMYANKIITDSGGIQKEAYILKKPCITLRSETEWLETVKAGWNLVVNPLTTNNYCQIIESFNPKVNYLPLFGENVAEKMKNLINNFIM